MLGSQCGVDACHQSGVIIWYKMMDEGWVFVTELLQYQTKVSIGNEMVSFRYSAKIQVLAH